MTTSASNPIDNILPRLTYIKRAGQNKHRGSCPLCSKRNNDVLSIKEHDDGHISIKCFTGCDTKDILAAIGLELKHLYPPRTQNARPRAETELDKAHKLFRQLHPKADRSFFDDWLEYEGRLELGELIVNAIKGPWWTDQTTTYNHDTGYDSQNPVERIAHHLVNHVTGWSAREATTGNTALVRHWQGIEPEQPPAHTKALEFIQGITNETRKDDIQEILKYCYENDVPRTERITLLELAQAPYEAWITYQKERRANNAEHPIPKHA
jgi:hypothetical protein